MRTLRSILLAASLLTLVGCSALTGIATNALTGGGGPSLDAQIGQENTKQIVGNQSTTTASGGSYIDQSRPQLRSDKVDNVTIVDTPLWIWMALFIALWVDSPKRWPSQIYGLVKKVWNRDKDTKDTEKKGN